MAYILNQAAVRKSLETNPVYKNLTDPNYLQSQLNSLANDMVKAKIAGDTTTANALNQKYATTQTQLKNVLANTPKETKPAVEEKPLVFSGGTSNVDSKTGVKTTTGFDGFTAGGKTEVINTAPVNKTVAPIVTGSAMSSGTSPIMEANKDTGKITVVTPGTDPKILGTTGAVDTIAKNTAADKVTSDKIIAADPNAGKTYVGTNTAGSVVGTFNQPEPGKTELKQDVNPPIVEDPYKNKVTDTEMVFNTNRSNYSPDANVYSRDLMSIMDDYGKVDLASIPALEKASMTMQPKYQRYTPDLKNQLMNAYSSILADQNRKATNQIMAKENALGMARSGRQTGLDAQAKREMGLNVGTRQADLEKQSMEYNNQLDTQTMKDYLSMIGQRNTVSDKDYQNKILAQQLNNATTQQQRDDIMRAMAFNNATKAGLYDVASNEARYQNELKRQTVQDSLAAATTKFDQAMRQAEFDRQNRGVELSNTAAEAAIKNAELDAKNALKKDLVAAMTQIFSSALVGGQSLDMGSLDSIFATMKKYGIEL